MDRASLAQCLRSAISTAVHTFRRERPSECPYAFALISSQDNTYIGFAIATEEGLRETARKYEQSGYRYQRHDRENADNIGRLSAWLRWANPDDGWHYGDFEKSEMLCGAVRQLFGSEMSTETDGALEAFCTDEVLAPLTRDANWCQETLGQAIIVGFTDGEDPRNFLRSATRANLYPKVVALWSQYWLAGELEPHIKRNRST